MGKVCALLIFLIGIIGCGVRGPLVPPKNPVGIFDIDQPSNSKQVDPEQQEDKKEKKNENK